MQIHAPNTRELSTYLCIGHLCYDTIQSGSYKYYHLQLQCSSILDTRWHNSKDRITKVFNLTHSLLNKPTCAVVSSYKNPILNEFLPKMLQQFCYKNIIIVKMYFYTIWMCNVKVKQSRNRPGVAQRVPGGLGSRVSWHSAREGCEVVSFMHQPPLPPGMFLVLIFTRGWVDPRAMVRSEGNMSLKNPVTPQGINPGTVRLVAQCLNHYATPGPTWMCIIKCSPQDHVSL